MIRVVALLLVVAPVLGVAAAPPLPRPQVDHHQHLLSRQMAESGQQPIDAKALIRMLDEAGIRRAVVLSNAFRYGSPEATGADEYARVVAENDWTASEAAKYPRRLTALCSFNPLKDYAITELKRCARDKRFGRAIKLQFGSSNVDFDDPTDIALLRRLFRAGNTAGMGFVIHLRTTRKRAYGAAQARVFMDELLPAAPDVAVQIAHLAGGGGGSLDDGAQEMLNEFAAAILRKDSKVRNLYFDLSGAVGGDNWPARAQLVVNHIRALGTARVVYGSDGGDPTDPPAKAVVAAYRQLPLTVAEFRAIDANVAPYLK
jgi:predicted TIM-barrel fold metal-dependent hydrolase